MARWEHILAVETSGREGSVALLEAEHLHGEIVLESGARHEAGLGPACRRLLAGCGWQPADLDAVAVGLGPGSFTGTRIGVTFAKTLAFALGLDIVGLPGLIALAVDASPSTERGGEPVVVMQRAHPSRVYGAVYEVGEGMPVPRREVGLWAPEELWAGWPPHTPVVGSAVAEHLEDLLALGYRPDPRELPVRAATLGRLASRHLREGGAPDDPMSLLPLYLQAPAAER